MNVMAIEAARAAANPATEHVDVLIVGAGISGLGAAKHLQDQCPGKSWLILEAFESYGGTWWSHRYPGIRSDSDLYTFGYRFKPWVGPPIATREEILKYLGEVIAENNLARGIRYRHRVETASWDSTRQRWTLTGTSPEGPFTVTANFLWMCQGYYRHLKGYMPEWEGMSDYRGILVHSMEWPEDLDLKDRNVIVIGSGATAATIVPNIPEARHVWVVQRSPTYFYPAPNRNDLADTMRALGVPEPVVHEATRRKILHDQDVICQRCFQEPELVRSELLTAARFFLGDDYPIDPHFTPRYRPWQQRLAYIPDGDMFLGIRSGRVTMVTGEIERFTPQGLRMKDGTELAADVIVAATGFNLCILGDIAFTIDGRPLNFADTVTYRGMMFTGVPNMVWIFGYFRASWTLRVDIVADFVCRLLNHMDAKGVRQVEVALRPEDHNMPLLPWIDEENFNPNYLKRALHLLPKRGNKPEWQHNQDYWREKDEFPRIDLDDAAFRYR
ncbi:MAG: NAD(P)/FAD-dependent oxidoreductase [Sphingomonadaceae bacterium]|uniref:flavin-containing monooxygenase n=1 Tax=Thermaurantiacus sp. TaxID=2820283 RepID=UPI00298ED9FD|nr:NAD(P)/FAD-dependent oxidoreductase [Thermaurantiacus sp.]MCS6986815.1 NAD(P)/FAD-dependent oxidoreductase [Sphingomonadaceae bacterium]MDW8413922.1 NAD(P)/FAD-dependent oxidoreductase [Thermaurantiacus sp.]